MDLSRNRIIFVTSTSCVFLLEQSSYLFCCTPLLPLTLGGAPPLHPLCTPYHRCCTPRLWRCTPLAPPRTLTGVGLWNITDVLEFPSTLMEQRTLDARGVLSTRRPQASFIESQEWRRRIKCTCYYLPLRQAGHDRGIFSSRWFSNASPSFKISRR